MQSHSTASPPTPLEANRWRFHLLALAFFLGLAVVSTWPLAPQSNRGIAQGTEEVATVPLASAWALWWTADRVSHGFENYWDAPIFHPTEGAFAMSEPMPLAGLFAAPLLKLGCSPALSLNLLLLVALTCNGAMAYVLLLRLGVGRFAALASGGMMVLLPYVHHQLGVFTLVPLAGILATIITWLNFLDQPTKRRGLWLGVSLAATFLLCEQYAVFTGISLAAASVVTFAQIRSRQMIVPLMVSVAVFAAMVLPIAVPQQRINGSHHFHRSEKRVREGSASLISWTRVSGKETVFQPLVKNANPSGKRSLFLGFLKIGLALFGLWSGWRTQQRNVLAWFFAIAVSAFLFSMMARWSGSWSPYQLMRLFPGISQIRSLWRWGVLAQVSLVILAGFGLAELSRRCFAKVGSRKKYFKVIPVVVALAAIVEIWPYAQTMASVPSRQVEAPLLTAIAEKVPLGQAILHLPMAHASVESAEATARAMYLSTFHHRALVNGYSSYVPKLHDQIALAMKQFPSASATAFLDQLGIGFLLIEKSWLERASPTGLANRSVMSQHGWHSLFRDAITPVELYGRSLTREGTN